MAPDAGNPFLDAGFPPNPPDAGAEMPQCPPPFDAGVPVCADAGAGCDPSTCAGCCNGDRCEFGTLDSHCGLGGNACTTCGFSEICSNGWCRGPFAGAAELSVEAVGVTDLHRSASGDLTFTVEAILANVGDTDAPSFTWAVIYSHDAHASLLPGADQVWFEAPTSLSAGMRRKVKARVTYTGGVSTQTAHIFVYADLHSEVPEIDNTGNNLGRSGPVSTVPACDPSSCSGCCTVEGCVVTPEQTHSVCGRAGKACLSCWSNDSCVEGRCQ